MSRCATAPSAVTRPYQAVKKVQGLISQRALSIREASTCGNPAVPKTVPENVSAADRVFRKQATVLKTAVFGNFVAVVIGSPHRVELQGGAFRSGVSRRTTAEKIAKAMAQLIERRSRPFVRGGSRVTAPKCSSARNASGPPAAPNHAARAGRAMTVRRPRRNVVPNCAHIMQPRGRQRVDHRSRGEADRARRNLTHLDDRSNGGGQGHHGDFE